MSHTQYKVLSIRDSGADIVCSDSCPCKAYPHARAVITYAP